MSDRNFYRPEIDGLRALAVIPVILFHAGFKPFSGGFIGVDVFFVISGYLITSIIMRDLQAGNFSFAGFYERRARRILPALFFVMLCCIPFAWIWMFPLELEQFAASVVSVCLFVSNFLFWHQSGYFDTSGALKPLLHTWSLAVEEQFYIVFPILLLLLIRFARRRITLIMIVGALLSLALSEYLARTHPAINFYWAPSRAWELLAGALMTRLRIDPSRGRDQALSLLGIALIVAAVFWFDENTPMPSLWAVMPVAGTCAVIACARAGTLANCALSQRPVVLIGLMSYSAYLWHQPLFAFARIRSIVEPSPALMAALCLATFGLAAFSWKYVELPWRQRRYRVFRSRRAVALTALSLTAALAIFGMIAQFADGFPTRLPASIASAEHRLRINQGLSDTCEGSFTLSEKCRTSDTPEIIVWGDSYAMHLTQGLQASNPDIRLVQMTVSRCGPFLDIAPIANDYPTSWARGCIADNDQVMSYIKATPSLRYAVLSSIFGQYVNGDAAMMLRDGKVVPGRTVAYDRFKHTLDALKAMGIKPVIFAPPPAPGFDAGECLKSAIKFGEALSICRFSAAAAAVRSREVIEFLAKIAHDYEVVWLNDAICHDDLCLAAQRETFIYRDIGHLSHEGSALIGKKMNFYGLITGR